MYEADTLPSQIGTDLDSVVTNAVERGRFAGCLVRLAGAWLSTLKHDIRLQENLFLFHDTGNTTISITPVMLKGKCPGTVSKMVGSPKP